MVLCGLYIFVGIMMACGAYNHLPASDPILVMTYVSMVHLIALPLLHFAIGTRWGKPGCLIAFLILNAPFILGLLIAVIVLSVGTYGNVHTTWTSNPLNHILIAIYLIDSVLLELLVGLFYRDIKKSGHGLISPTGTKTSSSVISSSSANSVPSSPVVHAQEKQPEKVYVESTHPQTVNQESSPVQGGPTAVPTVPVRSHRSHKKPPPLPSPSSAKDPSVANTQPLTYTSTPVSTPYNTPVQSAPHDESGQKNPELSSSVRKSKSDESPKSSPISIDANYHNANSPGHAQSRDKSLEEVRPSK